MNLKASTNDFLKQCKRVLRVARKPDREEYFQFSKVTALGIAIIGVIGFIFVLVATLVGL
ncbi:MAG: protein translocase SEC61 complex subunit gamma [Methanobrevibacter sp.]|jgi:protein transport protein SEC61 subunit gamma-like protein|nr:protein translocase SEC61 complex subunit gamma [Methanobrevibacter sp.]MEE0924810.1 protein translocase SEC61 complex subunit gamma [Methanobrevibacter sp.]MEE3443517.1 protein translocase SEC61 complex subunit gamma [Methanobrevibacter sp.]